MERHSMDLKTFCCSYCNEICPISIRNKHIDGLCFKYETQRLERISFPHFMKKKDCKKIYKIAIPIVGQSGAGKTSFINLLYAWSTAFNSFFWVKKSD